MMPKKLCRGGVGGGGEGSVASPLSPSFTSYYGQERTAKVKDFMRKRLKNELPSSPPLPTPAQPPPSSSPPPPLDFSSPSTPTDLSSPYRISASSPTPTPNHISSHPTYLSSPTHPTSPPSLPIRSSSPPQPSFPPSLPIRSSSPPHPTFPSSPPHPSFPPSLPIRSSSPPQTPCRISPLSPHDRSYCPSPRPLPTTPPHPLPTSSPRPLDFSNARPKSPNPPKKRKREEEGEEFKGGLFHPLPPSPSLPSPLPDLLTPCRKPHRYDTPTTSTTSSSSPPSLNLAASYLASPLSFSPFIPSSPITSVPLSPLSPYLSTSLFPTPSPSITPASTFSTSPPPPPSPYTNIPHLIKSPGTFDTPTPPTPHLRAALLSGDAKATHPRPPQPNPAHALTYQPHISARAVPTHYKDRYTRALNHALSTASLHGQHTPSYVQTTHLHAHPGYPYPRITPSHAHNRGGGQAYYGFHGTADLDLTDPSSPSSMWFPTCNVTKIRHNHRLSHPPPLIPVNEKFSPYLSKRNQTMKATDTEFPRAALPQSPATSLLPPSASSKELNISTSGHDSQAYLRKRISTWTQGDVLAFIRGSLGHKMLQDPDLSNFSFSAVSGLKGHDLLKFDESSFRQISKKHGAELFRLFLTHKAKEEQQLARQEESDLYSRNHHLFSGYTPPFESHPQQLDHSAGLDAAAPYEVHYETRESRGLGGGVMRMAGNPNLPTAALKSLPPLTRNLPAEHGGESAPNTQEEPKLEPPKKRGPGRPRKPDGLKKKKKKTGRLWEFIRNLLLNPETCPSLVRWENPEEGMFRFVQAEQVAQRWGDRKQNTGMNYEKLSRAMRYYYKTEIFEAVLGRRLVYKFGKNAKGWRPTNPNFPDLQHPHMQPVSSTLSENFP